jgi:hypothetical protein
MGQWGWSKHAAMIARLGLIVYWIHWTGLLSYCSLCSAFAAGVKAEKPTSLSKTKFFPCQCWPTGGKGKNLRFMHKDELNHRDLDP